MELAVASVSEHVHDRIQRFSYRRRPAVTMSERRAVENMHR